MQVMAIHATTGPEAQKPHFIELRIFLDDEDERAYQEYAAAHPMATEYRGNMTREEYVEHRLRRGTEQANGEAKLDRHRMVVALTNRGFIEHGVVAVFRALREYGLTFDGEPFEGEQGEYDA